VSEDPDFAAAWAGLGESRALLALYGVVAPRTIMPAARDAAHAALRLDPTLPEAHSTLGTVAALYDWNWRASQDAFRRALTLAPRSAAVHQRCAVDLLVPQRRFAEARDAIDRARTLDTLNVAVQASAGVVRYLSGDLAAAVDELRRVTNVYPDFAVGHYFLAAVLRDAGEYRDAGDAIERAIARDGGGSPEMIAARAQILARSGRVDDARAALGQLDDWERGGRPVSALRAQLHLALGEPAPALAALERAADAREAELIYLGARPVYQSLRNEPAFQSLLRRIGLP
jgi:predicted Zn-dependent protease